MDGPLRTIIDRFTWLGSYLLLAVRAFGYFISDGTVTGSTPLHLFGRNESIGVATATPIWATGTAYTWATANQTLTVRSSSALDAPANIGALTVRIWWLDSANVESTVDVALNGINPVVTAVVTARRVNRMEVLTVGVGGVGINEGIVTCYWTDNATVFASIPANRGISDGLIQTVPAGKRDVLWRWAGDASLNAVRTLLYNVYTRETPTAPWLVRDRTISCGPSSGDDLKYEVPLILAAGTDYYATAWEATGAQPAAGNLLGWREAA
jgi:hypothetical protein